MYLIDTNILIYYINGVPQAIDFINENAPLAISIISVIEVLSYPYDDHQKQVVINFLSKNFQWLYVDKAIAMTTAQHRLIKRAKTPDAIIGATAVCHHCTLITNNVKDFAHLGVAIINPIKSS